jgi:hypothetical protein
VFSNIQSIQLSNENTGMVNFPVVENGAISPRFRDGHWTGGFFVLTVLYAEHQQEEDNEDEYPCKSSKLNINTKELDLGAVNYILGWVGGLLASVSGCGRTSSSTGFSADWKPISIKVPCVVFHPNYHQTSGNIESCSKKKLDLLQSGKAVVKQDRSLVREMAVATWRKIIGSNHSNTVVPFVG